MRRDCYMVRMLPLGQDGASAPLCEGLGVSLHGRLLDAHDTQYMPCEVRDTLRWKAGCQLMVLELRCVCVRTA